MTNLIFINGAPGVGKTTTASFLQKELNSPSIDFGNLRIFHLKRDWSNQSDEEEQMSFENLVYILRNYIKHNYKNVIVTDLRDYRIKQIPELFSKDEYRIFTLTVANDEVLKGRVLEETRDSGYKDFQKAIEWNKREVDRPLLQNEVKIDNTDLTPEQVLQIVINHLTDK
jgi:hypothetical protein